MTTNTQNTDPVVLLQGLGFTEYEARAYATLVRHGPLNGYQLAKHSGIPRANVYAAANKLLKRSAVSRSRGLHGQCYQAVPPAELLRSIGTSQQRALKAADDALARLTEADSPAVAFNLRGDELLARARQLIDTCQSHMSIAIQQPEAVVLADALQQAYVRGVVITTLCLEACDAPCGGCQGKVHRFQLAPGDGTRWLVLSVDSAQAMMGQFDGPTAEGLVTSQHLVVELADAYVHQSVTLATLGDELAGKFDGLLSEQALRLLNAFRAGTSARSDTDAGR
ncbi:MAG TPA: helix-turn-helix domain-containing protein [Oleiagrimonas sp.]|nr:helix-turn-helix domain-containing protein [Oleiagrimonas sp.]